MTLLWFALGTMVGMFLPSIVAWVMTIGETNHRGERARRVSLEQMLNDESIIAASKKPVVPRQHGRHALSEREG